MSDLEILVGVALRQVGIRATAEVLGVSRGAATSIAAGTAQPGTLALAKQNRDKLERLIEVRAE